MLKLFTPMRMLSPFRAPVSMFLTLISVRLVAGERVIVPGQSTNHDVIKAKKYWFWVAETHCSCLRVVRYANGRSPIL